VCAPADAQPYPAVIPNGNLDKVLVKDLQLSEAIPVVLMIATVGLVGTVPAVNAAAGGSFKWMAGGVLQMGYRWDHANLSYWLNGSCDGSETKVIDSAFQVWHQEFPYFTFFSTHQLNVDIEIFCKAHLAGTMLGLTHRILRARIIEHVQIFLLAMPVKELMTVSLHEIGHALGLGHSLDPTDLMYYGILKIGLTPSSKDIQTLNVLYETPNTQLRNILIALLSALSAPILVAFSQKVKKRGKERCVIGMGKQT